MVEKFSIAPTEKNVGYLSCKSMNGGGPMGTHSLPIKSIELQDGAYEFQ